MSHRGRLSVRHIPGNVPSYQRYTAVIGGKAGHPGPPARKGGIREGWRHLSIWYSTSCTAERATAPPIRYSLLIIGCRVWLCLRAGLALELKPGGRPSKTSSHADCKALTPLQLADRLQPCTPGQKACPPTSTPQQRQCNDSESTVHRQSGTIVAMAWYCRWFGVRIALSRSSDNRESHAFARQPL